MDDIQHFVTTEATTWIKSERDRLWPTAVELPVSDLAQLSGYFEPATLSRARVAIVDTFQEPPFYAGLRARGLTELPSFARDLGVTFDDTIAIVGQRLPNDPASSLRLLVHELTHVEQYRRLGVDEFIRIYVASWLRERRYERIILEQHAFSVELNFHPSARMSAKQQLDMMMVDMGKHF